MLHNRSLFRLLWLVGLPLSVPVIAAAQAPSADQPAGTPLLAASGPEPEQALALPAFTVYGRSADLIGEAASSSQGRVGEGELADRPFLRRGELLEVIPGVVVTQHSGSGKANQYFLRGFNLDHGTDFGISVDGMPVNMRSHAHGQGYADINFIIPETVEAVNYEKGPFYAQLGDFSSAGAAQYKLVDTLPLGFATVEVGEYDFARVAAGGSFKTGDVNYTVAVESNYENGPFKLPEHAQKSSALLKRHWGTDSDHLDITAMSYFGRWRSSDQIPLRAVESGALDRFGNINPTDGGDTQRDSVSVDWTSSQGDTNTHADAYAIYYALNLYSDFTYFLDDPINGDQFYQGDKRLVTGGSLDRDWVKDFGSISLKNTVGLQLRDDEADVKLHKTKDRDYLSTIRDDTINEASASLYGKSEVHWTNWFRSEFGLRGDLYRFQVKSSSPVNSDTRLAAILSPKLGLMFQLAPDTEYYINAGDGFHSNDARGVTIHADPHTGDPTAPAAALVRMKSLETGLRTSPTKGLVSTVSLFLLDSQSELVLSGDDGSISPTGATRRYGVEFSNFYHPTQWLTLEGDISLTHARYKEDNNGGTRVPNSISRVVTGGVTVDLPAGFVATLRLRYFGPQPIVEDNSVVEPSSTVFNGRLGYRFRSWEVMIDVLNILNRQNDDIEYYYTSRLPGEPTAGVNDVHLHPMEPRQFRVTLTRHF